MVSVCIIIISRAYNPLYVRTLLKQGAYGGKPVVKRALVVTPGSLVKVMYICTLQVWRILCDIKIYTLEYVLVYVCVHRLLDY